MYGERDFLHSNTIDTHPHGLRCHRQYKYLATMYDKIDWNFYSDKMKSFSL
jgi:hypothetical protein